MGYSIEFLATEIPCPHRHVHAQRRMRQSERPDFDTMSCFTIFHESFVM